MRFRYARVADEALLLEWANDPVTRRNAFSPGAIAPETHHNWFYKRLRDLEGCRLYVAETMEGLPVGQVRFERQVQGWEVHYSIAPEFRRYGLGSTMLKNALFRLKREGVSARIFGRVKKNNIASNKIFEKLNFNFEESGMEDVLTYQLSLEEITADT